MCWYFNVSCTTSYVSSIWMIHSTGHHSVSYLLDWSIIIQENGNIYVAIHGGACSVNCMLAVWIASITESEMIIGKIEYLRWLLSLHNLNWSLGRHNVWDDYYDYWIWNDYYEIRLSEMILMMTECHWKL